jgi:hypothetical protein
MTDQNEQRRRAEAQSVWKGADPFTLVTAVREGFYELPKEQRDQLAGPLEEMTSRFEHQQRVALGTSVAIGAGSGS